jgi:hypothetical protein
MRIKLFEAFNKEDYYTKVDVDAILRYNTEDFTEEEFHWLNTSLNNVNRNTWWYFIEIKDGHFYVNGSGLTNIKGIGNIRLNSLSNDRNTLWIYKLEDDWWGVYYHTSYYMCDQFEGLEKLLKDKGII